MAVTQCCCFIQRIHLCLCFHGEGLNVYFFVNGLANGHVLMRTHLWLCFHGDSSYGRIDNSDLVLSDKENVHW